jgi:hypothetical protein
MLVVRFILRAASLRQQRLARYANSAARTLNRWLRTPVVGSLNRAPFWRCPVRRGDHPLSSIPGPRVFRPLHLSPRPGGRTTPRRFPRVRQVNSAFHAGAERVWRANNLGLVRQVDRRRLPSREIRAAVTKALHGWQKPQTKPSDKSIPPVALSQGCPFTVPGQGDSLQCVHTLVVCCLSLYS